MSSSPLSHAELLCKRVESALKHRTTTFHDEKKLQQQISTALSASGIAHQREVHIGNCFADFVIEECCVAEVKTGPVRGTRPLAQLGGYLEDPRFTCGILIATRASKQWIHEWKANDGRILPIYFINLWKNAL